MKKISVVLPVYNGEKYLRESIQSVINQTYSNWELIIVDDASTDSSPDIIREFAKTDNRIRFITNPTNQKLPESLNIGFRQASGEYLTWTSDDNLYAGDAFKIMAEALDEEPEYGMVFCDMSYIDENGDITGDNSVRGKKDTTKLYLRDCIGACFMYRHSIIEAIGEYDPDMFLVEDYDYWVRLSFKFKIKHMDCKPYFYRFHTGTLTASRTADVRNQMALLKLKHFDTAFDSLSEAELKSLYISLRLTNKDVAEKIKSKLAGKGVFDGLNVNWIDKECKPDENKKYIIFGAGNYGHLALKHLGRDNVEYFADNMKTGIDIGSNLKILSFNELKKKWRDYNIIIGTDAVNAAQIAEQLNNNGIDKYLFYIEMIDNTWQCGVNAGVNE